MADFVQGLDPGKLVLAGTLLSFVMSTSAAPSYNLPIFLFGLLAYESSDAMQSLKVFTGCLSVSVLFDLIWMFTNTQNVFVRLLSIILLLLKIPTTAAFFSALRQRGAQFMIGTDVAGPTVWSMPGGFTSTGRSGYQTVDDEPSVPPRVSVPPARPSSTAAPPLGSSVPGGYQNV